MLFEERFMDTPDKDFLLMIINSIMKGQQVSVKKVAVRRTERAEISDGQGK